MKILITGINGFVGTNLVKAFRDKYTLYGIDIASDVQDGVVSVDSWSDLNLAPDADVLIHLAGKAHDTINNTAEQEYFDINFGLTKKIFDLFLKSGAKKFIFFSSVKATADTVTEVELTEETIPAPQTPYGKSKLEAERYILSQNVSSDKKVFILRPCMIHGQGNKGNLNLLYNMVKKGIPYPLGAYSNRRSFTSVQNLNWIVEQLMVQDIPSGIYQVADDEPLSTNQLIYMMAETLHRKEQIWNISPKMINHLARLGDLLHLPLNSERLKKLTESYVVSNNKIKKALDIESMPVTAEQGMRATLQEFRNSKAGKI
jgi:nucleoside-diphosphate-sugar epimerase